MNNKKVVHFSPKGLADVHLGIIAGPTNSDVVLWTVRLLTPELLAKVFTYERMRVYMSSIMRIFGTEQSRSSKSGEHRSQLRRAQIS